MVKINEHHSLPNDLYMLPRDSQETNRLDFQHYLLRSAIKGNYLAPITLPVTILDVACGTGRWMMEMATTFPQSQLVGVDLTPPSREDASIAFPLNCHFQQCDVLQGLPFDTHYFDFVHQRFLIFALPLQHWPSIVRELVRVTRPGGWIELVEVDLAFHNQGPETTRLLQWIKDASQQRGIDISIGQKIGWYLREAGLINCQERKVPIPIGHWGNRLGDLLAKDFYGATRTLKPLVTAYAGISPEEFDRTTDAWLRECEEYHTSCDFFVAYGQSPITPF